MSKEWFVLQFKANSHVQAKKNLDQQGFETFLPLYDITSRKASRFINTTQPLFPGYMFVSFDKAETKWHKINNTIGVLKLITFNNIPRSISKTFIINLKKRYNLSDKLIPMKKFDKGDHVKVLKGPFAKFIATIETYESDQRIWILMDIMGRKAKIQSPSNILQPKSENILLN
jgi:transcriptional antiterminator RfaH